MLYSSVDSIQEMKDIHTLEVLPIEVIEEREQVEGEFDPSLPLAFVQRVRVHDARRVVEPGAAHHRPIHVPVHVVADEGDVEKEGEELSGDEEKRVEEDVEDVLGQHERVEAVALVDRALVVRLQLVECWNRQFLA